MRLRGPQVAFAFEVLRDDLIGNNRLKAPRTINAISRDEKPAITRFP
jgi:hypothetical protein